MYVAGQVQIEFFHGDHLRVPATRRASLDSEGRALAGLSNGGDDLFLQMRPQSLAKPNGGGAFAFSQRGRVDAAQGIADVVRLHIAAALVHLHGHHPHEVLELLDE